MFCEPSARSQTGPYSERRQVVRVRVADVDGDRVAAVLGEQRRQAPVDLLERLVPGRLAPARRRGGPAACVSRSGSSCSCLSPYAFGQMKPWLRTSSSSPRTDDHLPSPRRHLESAGGFAERTGAVVDGHGRSLLPPQLDPERLGGAQQPPRGVEQGARARGACARRSRAARTRSSAARRRSPGSRAAPSAAPAPSPGRLRSSPPARWWGSRAPPRRTPGARGRCRRRATRPASSRPRTRPSSQRAGEQPQPVAGRRGRGRRRSRWGRGGGRTSARGPPPTPPPPRRAWSASGTSSSSSAGSPSATSASPSRSSTRSPSRTTAQRPVDRRRQAQRHGHLLGADQARHQPAGVAAVGRAGRAVEAGGMRDRAGTRSGAARRASPRAPRAGRRPSGSRARAGGRAGGRRCPARRR